MLESPPAEIAYAVFTAIANMSEGCAATYKLDPRQVRSPWDLVLTILNDMFCQILFRLGFEH